jgi:hypothetical protein
MRIYEADDLFRLGMAARRRLGKEGTAVHCDLENATRGSHQLDLHIGKLPLQLSRQTGGSGLVVSDDAVFDADMHEGILSRGE